MWCSHCQQDVPAVARSPQGPLLCTLCEQEMAQQTAARQRHSQPADIGVELESYDITQSLRQQLDPPMDFFESEETRQSLRSIGRKLRVSYHSNFNVGDSGAFSNDCSAFDSTPTVTGESQMSSYSNRMAQRTSTRTVASWLISLLLVGGGAALCLGVILLAWSAAFQLPRQWQWGMTTTIAAEGTLMLGLVWMAGRLWHNGRNVNRQLSGVDRQLTDLQQLTGSLAGSSMSSSQHFYDHFHQTVSPHVQVANLRGQVDQLASRIGCA